MNKPNTLQVENARLIYRNFKGEGSRYNADGNRNFCLRLTRDDAMRLKEEGWNVKFPKQPEDGKFERDPFLLVSVKFGRITELHPEIYVKRTRTSEPVRYSEDMVGSLDNVEFDKVDLVIRPRLWTDDATGETHVKAYLSRMYATLQQDQFYDRFFNDDAEGVPFN